MNAQELITEHLDIWTTAQEPPKTGGKGRGKKKNGQSLYGIKKLRELILDLAIRGKLVEQNPEDEPAFVMLEKIAQEKVRLVKEGKIKKQKKLPEITEEEKPFALPDGWEWVRLGNVIEFVNGYAFKSKDFVDDGIGIVKIGNIQNGEITTASMARVEKHIVNDLDLSLTVNKGDMLIAMSGATTGKLGFNTCSEIFYLNQRVGKIIPYFLSKDFLYYPLTAQIAENLAKSMGSAIPNLSTAQIKNIILAIPPLPEQYRIVAKVDELMALCDQLEQQQTTSNATHQTLLQTLLTALTKSADHQTFTTTWEQIATHFDLLFTTEQAIDQFKQTILQLAVMGKLVHQNPKDEPASVLLEKIAKEKARLLKEGKIKKQKKLPEITEEEKPFALPEGWEWVRLGNYGRVFSGNSFKSGDFNTENGVKVIKITNAGVGKFIETEDYLPFDFLKEYEAYVVNKNDLIFALTRPYISAGLKISKCPGTYHKSLLNQRVAAVRLYSDGEYAFIYLQSLFVLNLYKERFSGGGLQPNLKMSDVTNLLIPIAPEQEQHCIVAKVDELMALCDQLKTRLHENQSTKLQLADTIVRQAVA